MQVALLEIVDRYAVRTERLTEKKRRGSALSFFLLPYLKLSWRMSGVGNWPIRSRRTETNGLREIADRFGETERLIAAIRDQLVGTCADLPIAL